MGMKMRLKLLLCYFAIFATNESTYANTQKDEIIISVNVRRQDEGETLNFSYSFNQSISLEYSVAAFCGYYNIQKNSCLPLMARAVQIAREKGKEDVIKTRLTTNAHLTRHSEAVHAENINRFRSSMSSTTHATNEQDIVDEQQINDQIYNEYEHTFQSIEKRDLNLKLRVCFIHSCSFQNQNSSTILFQLLETLASSNLWPNLDKLWIFHYGNNETNNINQYLEYLDTKYFYHQKDKEMRCKNKISIIYRSHDTSMFEAPTLRHIHQFSKNWKKTNNIQILYLHTLGVSYVKPYAQLVDWTRMILHFLVVRHEACYHLLKSGEYDTIGTNYISYPRHYLGNMWWAQSSYLTRLAPLPLTAERNDAVYWLLQSPSVTTTSDNHNYHYYPLRAYDLHRSNVDHMTSLYPTDKYVREMYSSSDSDESGVKCETVHSSSDRECHSPTVAAHTLRRSSSIQSDELRLLSAPMIEELWTRFRVTDEYLKKRTNGTKVLEEISHDMKEVNEDMGDYPRANTILDFKEWSIKYNFTTPRRLFITDPTEPELKYLNINRWWERNESLNNFIYENNQNDRKQKDSNKIYLNQEVFIYQYRRSLLETIDDVCGIQGDLHCLGHQNTFQHGNFDLVVFSQVLEHLYDPFVAIKNIYEITAPGGYVFTSVPSLNIPHFTPFHFYHFTLMALISLFIRQKFEVLEVGQWGNIEYERMLLQTQEWPNLQALAKVLDINNISNDRNNADQVWILARKPMV